MSTLPYQPGMDAVVSTVPLPAHTPAASDWRTGLPTLTGSLVTLRELRDTDAAPLLASLSSEEVARFLSPPPTTVEGFEAFIASTHGQRAAGHCACFAIVPRGGDRAVGLFQVRSLEAGFVTAEWGFAMASEYWATGMFVDGATLTVDFAVEVIGVRRLEARAALQNGRGNGALRKIGAVQEGILRRSFLRNGEFLDQVLWAILDVDWREAKVVWGPNIVVH